MTEWNHETLSFSRCRRRRVRADFSGGSISSNAGALLLREVDRRLGLTERVARALGDRRQHGKVRHEVLTMVRQRVHALALGYEDLNDHDALRHDEVVQTACERDAALASASTLCRFERRAEPQWAVAIHQVLVEQFIASHRRAPRELVIDFDATDDPVHGHQPGRFFHGYYDRYCFLPLYAFCGRQLLVAYLRPSNIDAARHTWAILSLLVSPASSCVAAGTDRAARGLGVLPAPDARLVRPQRRRIHRGACAKCGARRPSAIVRARRPSTVSAPRATRYGCSPSSPMQREPGAAPGGSSPASSTGPRGRNPRFIVTNLPGPAKELYERVYCQRGDMENRIKEQQLDLFADRTSCTKWWANQYRVLLAALAYTVLETMRRTALGGTALARAQCRTIRLRLLKIGAVVTPKHPHGGRQALQRLPRRSGVPAPGATTHRGIARSEQAVSDNTGPGVHPGPPPYARSRPHGPATLSGDRLNRSEVSSQPVFTQSLSQNGRREMHHYVRTKKTRPS